MQRVFSTLPNSTPKENRERVGKLRNRFQRCFSSAGQVNTSPPSFVRGSSRALIALLTNTPFQVFSPLPIQAVALPPPDCTKWSFFKRNQQKSIILDLANTETFTLLSIALMTVHWYAFSSKEYFSKSSRLYKSVFRNITVLKCYGIKDEICSLFQESVRQQPSICIYKIKLNHSNEISGTIF